MTAMTSQKTVAILGVPRVVHHSECMICEERDNYEYLIAAGNKHASSSKVKKFHVDSFICKLRDMALYLNDQKLLPKLAMGDVISNELFLS